MPRVVLPGAGTFNVSTLVYFSMSDFPPGSGICPAGPYTATVSLTATCNPSPGGSGMTSVPIVPGFNTINVPVTVGAGPPRLCNITGTVSTALTDGMTLSASGDTVVCLSEPAPGNPSVPRLDMEVLSPEIARFHPSDQTSYNVRITNNDPASSYSGELAVRMVNASRLPGASGPMPAGTGVFSISDPVAGDNFKLAFEEDLFEGCLPLPNDATDPAIPTLLETVDLDPGESIEIEVFTRIWGMCADGSCGEAPLVLDGDFADLTPGIACAGVVAAADTSQPPTFTCPDAGQVGDVVEVAMAPPSVISLSAAATLSSPEASIDFDTSQVQVDVDGLPSGALFEFDSAAVDPHRARTRIRALPAGYLDAMSSFDVELVVDVRPSPDQLIDAELLRLAVIPGAPVGFDDRAPVGDGVVELRPSGSPDVDSFFQFLFQVNVIGVDETGQRHELRFGSIEMTPEDDGSGFRIALRDGVVPAGPLLLDELEINQDIRAYRALSTHAGLGAIFTDGFESGNISLWSTAQP